MFDPNAAMEGGLEFPKTTWNFVTHIRSPGTDDQRAGLETLSRRYWKPIYLYLGRRFRKNEEDTKDLTQAFFLWLMERSVLQRYSPDQASFRSYLKGLLRNFILNQQQATGRIKRGGSTKHFPLHELRGLDIPDLDALTPEQAFDLAWKKQIMDGAIQQAQWEFASKGKADRFQAFKAYVLHAPGKQPSYSDVAKELGIKESDVGNYVRSVRKYLRGQISQEVSQTVANRAQFNSEWGFLFG